MDKEKRAGSQRTQRVTGVPEGEERMGQKQHMMAGSVSKLMQDTDSTFNCLHIPGKTDNKNSIPEHFRIKGLSTENKVKPLETTKGKKEADHPRGVPTRWTDTTGVQRNGMMSLAVEGGVRHPGILHPMKMSSKNEE